MGEPLFCHRHQYKNHNQLQSCFAMRGTKFHGNTRRFSKPICKVQDNDFLGQHEIYFRYINDLLILKKNQQEIILLLFFYFLIFWIAYDT